MRQTVAEHLLIKYLLGCLRFSLFTWLRWHLADTFLNHWCVCVPVNSKGVKQHCCVCSRQCVCILNEKKPWSYSLEKTIWATTPPISGEQMTIAMVLHSPNIDTAFRFRARQNPNISQFQSSSRRHPGQRALPPLQQPTRKRTERRVWKSGLVKLTCHSEEIHKPCLDRKFSNVLFLKRFFFFFF